MMDGSRVLKTVSPWIVALALLGLLLPAAAPSAAIPQAEREALLALYESTGGPGWLASDNWGGPAGTENTWYGVVTDPGNTTVVALHLAGNNLSGALPPQLGDLANLEEADFSATDPGESGDLAEEDVSTSSPFPDEGLPVDGAPHIYGVEFRLRVENGVVLVCKLTLMGYNFQDGCIVKIDGQPAPKSIFETDVKVLAKGGAKLKKMLPKGRSLQLTVTNPDEQTSNAYAWQRP